MKRAYVRQYLWMLKDDNQSLIFDCVLYCEQILSREHGLVIKYDKGFDQTIVYVVQIFHHFTHYFAIMKQVSKNFFCEFDQFNTHPLHSRYIPLKCTIVISLISPFCNSFNVEFIVCDNNFVEQQRSSSLTFMRNLMVNDFLMTFIKNEEYCDLTKMTNVLLDITIHVNKDDIKSVEIVCNAWNILLNAIIDPRANRFEQDQELLNKIKPFGFTKENENVMSVTRDSDISNYLKISLDSRDNVNSGAGGGNINYILQMINDVKYLPFRLYKNKIKIVISQNIKTLNINTKINFGQFIKIVI